MIPHRLRQTIVIPTIELTWKTAQPLSNEDSVRLRGFVGMCFAGDDLKHNHANDGLRYSYPRVQYKVIDAKAKVIGLSEGVESVKQLLEVVSLTIGKDEVMIINRDVKESNRLLGVSNQNALYSFLTPWLALNQQNYGKYQRLGTSSARKAMLEAILIGNLISMSKSLGYTVPGPLTASIHKMREVKASLKGTPMLGFLGDFSVNFEIPDYWGIGKSVSRGFGTVKRCPDGRSTMEHP